MEYLLKASVVICLFYLCFFILLKKETFFQQNRWFLLTGLIIALVFPLIVIPVYIPIEPIAIQENIFIQNTISEVVVASPKTTFEWLDLLPIIYGIGFALFSIQFIFQFGSLVLLLLKNPKYKDKRFTYVIVETKISPFSFFKWIVYNPESYKDEELQLILTHEKVHVNQFHSLDILVTQLACVVFWFNPLIWLYRKEVRQNLEYIADYKTLNESKAKKEYQHLLLKTSFANHDISLSNNFYNSSIKKRIVMLNKSRSKRTNQWKYLLMLPLLAGLLMSMNTENVYIETESKISSVNEEAIYEHNPFEIMFTKGMTDEQLDDIKKELNSQEVSMKINRLKRNKNNAISEINIDFKNKNSNVNYSVKNNKGIDDFYFAMDANDRMSVEAIIEITETITVDDLLKNNTSTPKNNSYDEYDTDSLEVIFEDSTNVKYINGRYKGIINKLQNSKDTIYVRIDSAEVKRSSKQKSDLYYEDGRPVKIISEKININTPSSKVIYNSHQNYLQNPKPLMIVDGKTISSEYFKSLNPNAIESMSVLKGESAIEAYGEKGKNGVIIIKTKQLKNLLKTQNNTNDGNQIPNEDNYLYILDGKEISKSELIKVYSIETVSSLKVLKGKEAKEKYGEKGINGVVEVISKNSSNTINSKTFNFTPDKETTKKDNPTKYRVEVSSYVYLDDDDAAKNGAVAYISKYTPDRILDDHKANLEKIGITVKYSKLKRNDAGEITSIKISLNDGEGRKSSATWKVDDGIPNIEFGKTEGSLIARTK